jgi:hypothetical protein
VHKVRFPEKFLHLTDLGRREFVLIVVELRSEASNTAVVGDDDVGALEALHQRSNEAKTNGRSFMASATNGNGVATHWWALSIGCGARSASRFGSTRDARFLDPYFIGINVLAHAWKAHGYCLVACHVPRGNIGAARGAVTPGRRWKIFSSCQTLLVANSNLGR